MKRKILAAALTVAMLLSLSPFVLGATISADGEHWADDSIAACGEMGVFDGLANSGYDPDEKATRGDMFKMMDNVMNYPDADTDTSFTDLDESHPHYETLMNLAAAGIAQGYDDGTMRPDAPVTREEAMAIFARAFTVDGDASASYQFTDSESIADWARAEVGGMKLLGYIEGYLDGSFGPKLNITMGELARMIDNLLAGTVGEAGTYTEDFGAGYAVVNVPGVTLKDMTVEGDLIAAAGIGKGDLTLDGVTVGGRLIVNGGGVNSIIITGDSDIGEIIVYVVNGQVSIKVLGNASVEVIYVEDGSDDVFINGTISELYLNDDTNVTLNSGANVGDIAMQGDNAALTISSGASAGGLSIMGDDNNVVVNGTLENGAVDGDNNTISGGGKITGTVTYTGGEGNEITVPGTKVVVEEGAGDVTAGSTTVASGDDGVVPGGTTTSGGTYSGGGYVPGPSGPTAAQTLADTLNAFTTGAATVSGNIVTLSSEVDAGAATITIPNAVTLTVTGTLTTGIDKVETEGTGKLVISTSGKFVQDTGSAEVAFVNGTNPAITLTSGTIELTGKRATGFTVTLNGAATINGGQNDGFGGNISVLNGDTYVVSTGSTMTNNGTIHVQGKLLVNGKLVNNGLVHGNISLDESKPYRLTLQNDNIVYLTANGVHTGDAGNIGLTSTVDGNLKLIEAAAAYTGELFYNTSTPGSGYDGAKQAVTVTGGAAVITAEDGKWVEISVDGLFAGTGSARLGTDFFFVSIGRTAETGNGVVSSGIKQGPFYAWNDTSISGTTTTWTAYYPSNATQEIDYAPESNDSAVFGLYLPDSNAGGMINQINMGTAGSAPIVRTLTFFCQNGEFVYLNITVQGE